MALTRRYEPPATTGPETYGMDFSMVIPAGMVLVAAGLTILTNTQPPTDVTSAWDISPIYLRGRQCFATLGITGYPADYQLVWTATDNRGNVHQRAGLLLVTTTS